MEPIYMSDTDIFSHAHHSLLRGENMRLKEKEYTIDSFLEEIVAAGDELFEDSGERKWLKMYLLYAQNNWLSIFEKFNPKKNGELYFFSIPKGDGKYSEYYVGEFVKDSGLLILFTAERQEDYEKTLSDYIGRKRGITQMWIPPEAFKQIRNYLISNHDARIYLFNAKRNWSSEVHSEYRPDFSRTIHYHAEDGNYAIKEFEQLYGVVPTLIDFRVGADALRITNEGLFVVRSINRKMLRLPIEIVNNILYEQLRLRRVSTSVNTHTTVINFGKKEYNVREIESGRIKLNRNIDTLLIRKLFRELSELDIGRSNENEAEDFSFIDTSIRDSQSLSYSATVIDRRKGTVFGLSGSKEEMILVPMHRTTFESFMRFYQLVAETLDSHAMLGVVSEAAIAK